MRYRSLGCWKVDPDVAVPTFAIDLSRKVNSVELCSDKAKAEGYELFTIQNGGWCTGISNGTKYEMFGAATTCRNGRGGPWANDVYEVGGKTSLRIIYQ